MEAGGRRRQRQPLASQPSSLIDLAVEPPTKSELPATGAVVGEGQTEMMMNDAPTILNPNLAPTVETTPLQDAVKACQVTTFPHPPRSLFCIQKRVRSRVAGIF